ncbi:FAD-NAD(P)-binding protein [Shimwellia pseudoproteus]|uniref:FAD-NAD(P)-binding protein n=1 Tax=Shimwellia pseudoproteus TaxID=570012 RepID=UPI0018EA7E9F|nr:FAD-NAD(P)-binding protein [Shimwellia pseudoproteus]MBJ3813999.1 FAD-NAD(P)-binding protein [Shimwellia pseudoproteus]
MKNIAIVGAGPTGIYTLYSLIKRAQPVAIAIFEQASSAGVGMPYSREENANIMLANIASIEIPPLGQTYLEWLKTQDDAYLSRYGVVRDNLHVRQFLPRILLGDYFHHQFQALVAQARALGYRVAVHEACPVTDLQATAQGVRLWRRDNTEPDMFDFVAIATGHVWPDKSEATRAFYPSPWSGLMEAHVPPGRIGILGASLSGIDAAMAVAIQHGDFISQDEANLRFRLHRHSHALKIVLMSRTGILPEADFYCPIPYQPLQIVTPAALRREIASGAEGLLDRVFQLMVQEITLADPDWSARLSLHTLDADSFTTAWFAERQRHDPFLWARRNLREVEHNKHQRYTVPWRYAVLRLHEAFQEIIPWLTDQDARRVERGLARVFIDNYAAVPPQSIRRLLALHDAGVLSMIALGEDYRCSTAAHHTTITVRGAVEQFDVFIDARGQQALQTEDLPFPSLRRQIQSAGEAIPPVSHDYTLLAPDEAQGRIAFGAIPWLMHDRPFIQGLIACAEIGEAMAGALYQRQPRPRWRLAAIDL